MTQVIKLCVVLKEGSMVVFSQPDSGWFVALTKLIQTSAAVLEGEVLAREWCVWIPVCTYAPDATRFYCPSAFLVARAIKQNIQGICAQDVYEAEHSPYCWFCFCMCLLKDSPAASPPWVPQSALTPWQL